MVKYLHRKTKYYDPFWTKYWSLHILIKEVLLLKNGGELEVFLLFAKYYCADKMPKCNTIMPLFPDWCLSALKQMEASMINS